VEPDCVLAFLRTHFDALLGDVQESFKEFDTSIPARYRLIIEKARPKAMSLTILDRWRQRYGTSGNNPLRLAKDKHGMEYLFMEGEEFCVGLRNKKLDDCGQCYQHISDRQTELRSQGYFPEFKMQVVQVFLGYRYTDGVDEVEPRLTDISLSAEHVTTCGQYDVSWRRVIWDTDEGIEPVRPIQPPLIPPPAPVIRPRRRRADEGGRDATQGG
jgi:hypothetical protein